jgi:transcriptional regulator with XRE-family HTH domain
MTASDLSTARAHLGLTQAEVARALGVDLRTYRRWESGELELGKVAFDLTAAGMVATLHGALTQRPTPTTRGHTREA